MWSRSDCGNCPTTLVKSPLRFARRSMAYPITSLLSTRVHVTRTADKRSACTSISAGASTDDSGSNPDEQATVSSAATARPRADSAKRIAQTDGDGDSGAAIAGADVSQFAALEEEHFGVREIAAGERHRHAATQSLLQLGVER